MSLGSLLCLQNAHLLYLFCVLLIGGVAFVKTFHKLGKKSASGRKARVLPDRVLLEEQATSFDSPTVSATASRRGIRFTRRAGASIKQRVLSRGRGTPEKHAVTGVGLVVVRQEGAHVRLDACAALKTKKKARLTIENNGERRERSLEKRTWGEAEKIVVPCTGVHEAIIVISDEEDREDDQLVLTHMTCEPILNITSGESGFRQFVPRLVSPMLCNVQEREVENQKNVKAGEQVEFVDSSGLVTRGTICGETSGSGESGMAQVRLDFWQSGVGALQTGCDGTHVLGEHGEQSTRRLGRPPQVQQLPLRVGAHSGHRLEERVQSRAVCQTTGDLRGPGLGIQDFYQMHECVPSTSRGAVATDQEAIEDVLLDYEEEDELEEVLSGQRKAVQSGVLRIAARGMVQKAVQNDHRVGGERQVSVAGNLPRGETNKVQPSKTGAQQVRLGCAKGSTGMDMAIQTGLIDNCEGIEVSIQVEGGEAPSKSEVKEYKPLCYDALFCVTFRFMLMHFALDDVSEY
ncbi:hypothetical protein NDU88_005082 [Pleurodeles waltl]|uniref:Uncharacterized protein n=1 Tax=Pleurodeles waltl TaxID=8319 RepID=A0AAV7TB78_PLEWA|nr:hypothetical protein NDU88_005082 [Pleurodeles waltl]